MNAKDVTPRALRNFTAKSAKSFHLHSKWSHISYSSEWLHSAHIII